MFSLAAGAPCARSEIFFHGSISFAKTVPMRYHMPLGEVGKYVCSQIVRKGNFPQNQLIRADDLIVLLFSVVPSLASLAPERQ